MPLTPSVLDFDPDHSTILKDISTSLENHNHTATFALGGSIPNHPITIRFGNIPNQGSHITFPIHHASHPSVLEDLISECQPASFGRGGEAVLDPTYRKAGALGTDLFATTFCPYRSGIVDVIQRMLLPMGNVRAELYKLNIYSAPSGKFKAHVDTPRDVSQFGSLVVGLPLLHEGGELLVRHAQTSLSFAWGNELSAISWTAFYSDCEHEVREVIAGHRITLTYNLYSTPCLPQTPRSLSLDPTQLPLFTPLNSALDLPSFLPLGRILAIHLTHSYAHTASQSTLSSNSLKGADMAIYHTATALGLPVFLRPIAFLDKQYCYDYCDEECDSDCDTHSGSENGEVFEDITVLGSRFKPMDLRNEMRENEQDQIVRESLCKAGGEKWDPKKVTWLNERKEGLRELQVGFITTYGNEPSLGLSYSHAVMLIRIPPWEERGKVVEILEKAPIFGGVGRQSSEHRGLKRSAGQVFERG